MIAIREFAHAPLLLTLVLSTFGLNAVAVIFQTWGYIIATPTAAGLGYGLDLRVEDIALFVSLYSLFSFIGGLVTGRALRTVRPGWVTIAIFVIAAAGYAIALLSFTNVTGFAIGAGLIALAGGSVYGLVYTMVAFNAPRERQASTAAAVTVGGNVGGALIPVIWLTVLNSSATYVDGAPVYSAGALGTVFALSIIVALLMVGIGVLLLRVRQPSAPQPTR